MTVQPLGDQAILVSLPDESAAVRFTAAVRAANAKWLLDVVPAYSQVGVYFDADQVTMSAVMQFVRDRNYQSHTDTLSESRRHRIPVCYERGPDLDQVALLRGLTPADVIQQHLATEYTIYAIGFVPGFPYMGYLPESLAGVGRLASPRVRVEPGSVGVTGRQTAIYPLPRPGGWHLIGQTPLTIVDVEDGFFPLRVGDRVQFARIDDTEYEHLLGERL
ncbi:MAG: 5-oxoprolinase subunit PxpB [Bacteroidales bacterium]|nr:5-oxoprolinase subunit PxpB [Bacteroidales bacterium]